MKLPSRALTAVAVAAVLLTGCTPAPDAAAAGRGRAFAGAHATESSPPEVPAEDALRAALTRTHRATYRFKVRSGAPDQARIRGTGAVDPKARRMSTDIKITGGKFPSERRRIVIRNDMYDHDDIQGGWAHLDMKRLKKSSDYLRVDMADPVGLGAFTTAIASVRRTGARTYAGTFDTTPDDADEFLPIGAPTLVIFGGTATFTATTDARGWVTRIDVKLSVKETLTMTTTFSGHGKPLSITKPRNVGEVDDFSYE